MCLSAYLRYSPRVRPPRPSPPSFSSLKICPEEWQEEIWGLTKIPSSEGSEPLVAQCHVSCMVQSHFTCVDLFPQALRAFGSSVLVVRDCTIPYIILLFNAVSEQHRRARKTNQYMSRETHPRIPSPTDDRVTRASERRSGRSSRYRQSFPESRNSHRAYLGELGNSELGR